MKDLRCRRVIGRPPDKLGFKTQERKIRKIRSCSYFFWLFFVDVDSKYDDDDGDDRDDDCTLTQHVL